MQKPAIDRYYNRATSLTGLEEIADERGEYLGAAFRAVDLSIDLLRKPDERVPFDKLCSLLEYCADQWRMPDFGLQLARYQHLDILGPVALVTRMERSLRGAVNAIIENLVIHSTATFAAIKERGDVATLTIDATPVPGQKRQHALLTVAVAKNVIEQAGGAKIDLIEVSFRQPEGNVGAAVRAHFCCPVRFEAENNALFFDRKVLDTPIARTDTAYHAIIGRYLAEGRNEAAARMRDLVLGEIARQMEFGSCTLESVAQRLRVESRSLQRRLHQEGVSFRDLVEEWRRGRALSLITHTRLPLSEVSLAMGYANQSIFTRAFERWYGSTPLSFRQKSAYAAA